MKTIYLIRHGESLKESKLKYLYNIDDQTINEMIPLSIEGEKEVYEYRTNTFNERVDYIWSSGYNRAISTAKYFAIDKDIKISNLFNERKLGITKNVKDEFWLTQLNDENSKTIEGESRYEVTKRMYEGIEQVLNTMEDNKNAVIISHATSITFLLMKWCSLDEVILEGKKRCLSYNNKVIVNNTFYPLITFKLEFENNKIISIKCI